MSLGCGAHTAMVVDRDGATVCHLDVLVQVEWTRVLSDVSQATVVVQPGGDCCDCIGQVRTWRHKLVIWRDQQPVWEGPILRATWQVDSVRLEAADVLAWLDRRVPHRDMVFTNTDLSTVAEWLITDGFRPDDPGHQVQIIGPARIRGDREYEQDVGQTGEHLRELAETGVDFTAVGSRILILPEDHCERVGSLTDDDFPEGLTVVEDGAAVATRWVLWGRDEVKGQAGGVDGYYRLLERVDDVSSILDGRSAAAAARSRLRVSTPAPVVIDSQSATLSPDAAVEVAHLVPGWCLNITSEATCRSIRQTMKLHGLAVSETGAGETVAATIAPAGTD